MKKMNLRETLDFTCRGRSVSSSLAILSLTLFISGYCQRLVADSSHTVKVMFETDKKGPIFINVFDQPEGFPDDPKKAMYSKKIKSNQEIVTLDLTNVKNKTLALAAFVDQNKNGKLDTNALGVPIEPFAFSENPTIAFSAPSFEDARVDLENRKQIRLKFKTF